MAAEKKQKKKAKIGLDREFKKNQDFQTKSQYFIKMSRALPIKSQIKFCRL